VADSGKSNAIRFAYEGGYSNGASYSLINAPFTTLDRGSANYNRFIRTVAQCGVGFIHLAYDGSQYWRCWYSNDDRSYSEVTSGSPGWSKTFTPAYLQLTFQLNQANATDIHLGCDWVQVNWMTLP
jgi:hypothetical protein